jgi:subtilase family serine protease
VLRPPGGPLTGREQITAATVRDYLPEPATVQNVRHFFERAGFSIEGQGGLGFSIVGPAEQFERVFGTKLIEETQRSVPSVQTERGQLELPLTNVPKDIASRIEAVTFTPPPDFGPTDFSR